MASVLKHSDFNLVHRYLCGDREAGSELYASIFPIVKGFIYSHKNAADIAKDHKAGDEMGLSVEEKAFYDALLKPATIKDFFSNDALVQITKELTQMLSKSRTVDWQKKEQVRANMRPMVKRLLKKYVIPT